MVTQDALLHRAWGNSGEGEPDSLWVRIRNLRRKIGDTANPPRYLLTERGVGYRFAEPGYDPAAPSGGQPGGGKVEATARA